jgi:hypothetical protein
MTVIGDADRYSNVKIELACPKCGSAGLIPVEHLDRVLSCTGCSSLFRVEASGLAEWDEPLEERISVQVRSSSSAWHDHEARIEKAPSVAKWLRAGAIAWATSRPARWGAACGAALLIFGSVALSMRESAPPPTADFPTSLDERAALFTEALARRDMEVLIRLTDPSQHRALRTWLAHGADLPPRTSDDDSREHPRVESEVLSKARSTAGGDTVDVRVRLNSGAEGKQLVLDERWVRQGEQWYFRPVRLRWQAQRVTWPATKQRRRGGS